MITYTKDLIEKEFTQVIFRCSFPGCNFNAPYQEDVESHYAKSHLALEKKGIGDKIFYKFEEEEAAQLWFKNKARDCRVQQFAWEGPGWYTFRTWTQRCPRNCCDDYCGRLVSLNKIKAELMEFNKEIIEQLEAIGKLE